MKKKNVIILSVLVIIVLNISVIFGTEIYKESKELEINKSEINEYCINENSSGATKFLYKEIGNYYLAISEDRSQNTNDKLFIFKKIKDDKYEIVDGSTKEFDENIRKDVESDLALYNYQMYIGDLPENKNDYKGLSHIYYSSNEAGIKKIEATMLINDEEVVEAYNVDPTEAFIIKIDEIGNHETETRYVKDVVCYDSNGKVVPELRDKN